jgi:hypothetical protein
MFTFCTHNNTILKINYNTYKGFGINFLTNLVIERSITELKNKYRPQKCYNINDQIINQLENIYFDNQVFLNPYLQIKYIINESIKYFNSLHVNWLYQDNVQQIKLYNYSLFYKTIIPKIYRKLNKIYKYRNNLFFKDLTIDNNKIDVDSFDSNNLELIYKLKPNYILDVSDNTEMNMDDEHPFIDQFKYNTKLFYIYLLEYQMLIDHEVYNLCWKYIHDYIINNCSFNDKLTMYFINPDDKLNIIKSKYKNKIGFVTNLNDYYNLKAVFKLNSDNQWFGFEQQQLKPKFDINIEDIYNFAKQKYGCVLNFGSELFEIPIMDFIEDYTLVI